MTNPFGISVGNSGTPGPPAAQRNYAPNGFDQAERPRALEKAIRRPEEAGAGETQNKPMAATFQGVADQHGRYGNEAEKGQAVQERLTIWAPSGRPDHPGRRSGAGR